MLLQRSRQREPRLRHFCHFISFISTRFVRFSRTQPVLYEFERLKSPTLLIIGQRERTTIGKDCVPKEVAARMGDYPVLGKAAAARIPSLSDFFFRPRFVFSLNWQVFKLSLVIPVGGAA